MLSRTRWRLVEEPCLPGQARARWEAAREAGATGAVTAVGSGIRSRDTIRLYWEKNEGAPLPEGEDLVEENWTPYWRESLGVIPVTPAITLAPPWEDVPEDVPGLIRIDPGMAFGAGDHPTTRLCLSLLEHLATEGRLRTPVLDVGSGTGVLALAAALLGAEAAVALDIDPFGYASCRRNVQLNRREETVHPLLRSLDLLEGEFPVILANIVASQLEHLAALLRERLAPPGLLVLSGFEARNEGTVRTAVGLPLRDRREEAGWVALLLEQGV